MAIDLSKLNQGIEKILPIVNQTVQSTASVIKTIKDVQGGSKPAVTYASPQQQPAAPSPSPATKSGIKTEHILIGGGILTAGAIAAVLLTNNRKGLSGTPRSAKRRSKSRKARKRKTA